MAVTKFKHRKNVEIPRGYEVEDEHIKSFLDDLGKALIEAFKNIYDDLCTLEKIEYVSTLPSAGAEYRGKIYGVQQGSAKDKIYICRLDTSTSTYSWDEVSFV